MAHCTEWMPANPGTDFSGVGGVGAGGSSMRVGSFLFGSSMRVGSTRFGSFPPGFGFVGSGFGLGLDGMSLFGSTATGDGLKILPKP